MEELVTSHEADEVAYSQKGISPFRLRPSKFGMFEIIVESGGTIPKSLQGTFNNSLRAKEAIERYLAHKNRAKRVYHKSRSRLNGQNAKAKSSD